MAPESEDFEESDLVDFSGLTQLEFEQTNVRFNPGEVMEIDQSSNFGNG